MVVIPITSKCNRSKETIDTAISIMNESLPSEDKIRKTAIIYSILGGTPDFSKFKKLYNQKIAENGRTPEEFCNKFRNNEFEIKPENVIKDFINELLMVFQNAIKNKRKNTIITFRHGDKDQEGNLTEKGREQAKKLGENLKKEIDNEGATILAAGHNIFNETIIHTIFSGEELPKEWDNLLGFTESVKYTFYPEKGKNEPYLEIEWRGIKKEISYKDFKNSVEKLTK